MEIIGYENYKIYENGNIERFGKILKPTLNMLGYYYVSLYKDCKEKKFKIHRLIALHFIDNPENLPVVDHIDRDTKNCDLKKCWGHTGVPGNPQKNFWAERIASFRYLETIKSKNLKNIHYIFLNKNVIT